MFVFTSGLMEKYIPLTTVSSIQSVQSKSLQIHSEVNRILDKTHRELMEQSRIIGGNAVINSDYQMLGKDSIQFLGIRTDDLTIFATGTAVVLERLDKEAYQKALLIKSPADLYDEIAPEEFAEYKGHKVVKQPDGSLQVDVGFSVKTFHSIREIEEYFGK